MKTSMKFLFVIAVVVVLFSIMERTEGRYLLTRSDETRLEEIKNVLRDLLGSYRQGGDGQMVKREALE